MPGSNKRKIDQDTWIVSQSKRSKIQLPAQIHETTLAALRLGSRNFFNKPAQELSLEVNGRQRNFSSSSSPSCHYCWTMNRNVIEKCTFCEKSVCHLSQCFKCSSAYCLLCGVEKYDQDSKFVCFGCM